MQTFLRITLLGVFAAAGISVAVGLAVHTKDTPPAIAASVPAQDVVVQKALFPTRSQSPLPVPYRIAVGSRGEQAKPPAEASTEAIQQQQDRMRRLEESLRRAEGIARQNQIDRIEMALRRVEDSAQENQRHFDRTRDSQQQDALPQAPLEQAPFAQAPRGKSIVSALAQNIRLDDSVNNDAPQGDDQDGETPKTDDPHAGFHKEEGDGRLTINSKKTDVRDLLNWLSEQGEFNIVASQSVQGVVSISLTDVDVQTAMDAVLNMTGFVARRERNFIFVGTPADLENMDHLRDKIGTRIYRTNYVKASEVQTLITPMLSKGVGQVTVSSPSEIDIASDTAHTGGDGFAGNEVLIVRDYEQVLIQIDQIILEIDRRPLQISIEAIILSVNLDDSHTMGVNFELLRDHANARVVSGSPLANLASLDISNGGLNFGFLDSNLAAFVEALETIGDTNVIATPRLMCLNKQYAEILIGQQRGYLTTTQTETAVTQQVEFLDVGTQLRIRPFISQDGMIRMEVHPELSTGDVRLIGDFALPDKEVTQVTTNVICRDGGTIILGGLIRNELGTTTSQIPLLGNLPLVGGLFRNKTETTIRNEIIILITPRIVREPHLSAEGRKTFSDVDQRNSIYADKMSPLGKRYYGRRYFRMAQSALNDGKLSLALRFINLSIHFDPSNLLAIDFRNSIASGTGNTTIESEEIHGERPPGRILEELPPPIGEIRSARRKRNKQYFGPPPQLFPQP